MEVDETMIAGQIDHPRFIGERFGRFWQCLTGAHRVGHEHGALAVLLRMQCCLPPYYLLVLISVTKSSEELCMLSKHIF